MQRRPVTAALIPIDLSIEASWIALPEESYESPLSQIHFILLIPGLFGQRPEPDPAVVAKRPCGGLPPL
jgi:hypothetical protein